MLAETFKMKLAAILLFLQIVFADINTAEDLQRKYLELPYEEYIEYFNKQNFSWKAQVPEREYPLGVELNEESFKKLDYQIYDDDFNYDGLPETFDARKKWANCPTIHKVYDQEHCGSCWAFAVATTMSDRTCIYKAINVEISKQDFECCRACYKVNPCKGGDPTMALQFWIDVGYVTDQCKPYRYMELLNPQCKQMCENGQNYANDKHHGHMKYRVGDDENMIKRELFEKGPIIAIFQVFSDFESYSSGVYIKSPNAVPTGYHAVKLIGYGVENNIPYWLAVNSWGAGWAGMGGLFKVKRYGGIEFESYLITGTPRD